MIETVSAMDQICQCKQTLGCSELQGGKIPAGSLHYRCMRMHHSANLRVANMDNSDYTRCRNCDHSFGNKTLWRVMITSVIVVLYFFAPTASDLVVPPVAKSA